MKIKSLLVIPCVFFVAIIACCTNVLHDDDAAVNSYKVDGDGSLHVYFINLDKSIDRLKHVVPQLDNLGYEFTRISAVYGKKMPFIQKEKFVDRAKYRFLMRSEIGDGTIGCYLSHIKTWQTFLKSTHSYALVFEDDVVFNPVKLKLLIENLKACNTDWDLVNIDVNRPGNPRIDKKLGSSEFLLVKFRTRVGNTSCYLISRETAIKLLKKALPIVMPIDHYLARFWETGIKLRGVIPKPVRQGFGDSEIDMQGRRADVGFLYCLSSFFFQLSTHIITFIQAYL
ncbi:MAG: glycosyltransferase family 25 protein [Holosporales bacterium]|jgi:glycosyl transferase family 25|nr:glycosyltransferase family 25 protein [Holosporales bacterium]